MTNENPTKEKPRQRPTQIAFWILIAIIAALSVLAWRQESDIGLGLFMFTILAAPLFLLRAVWRKIAAALDRRQMIENHTSAPQPPEATENNVAPVEAKTIEIAQEKPATPIQTDEREADTPVLLALMDDTYRFIAIDVETANSETTSICQVGLAMVRDNLTIENIAFYIDPEDEFDDFNVNLHGISDEDVQDEPTFAEFIQLFRPFLERHPLVQHSDFDQKAIDGACRLYSIPKLRSKWYDSVKIARNAWPELKGKGGHGLANLKKELGLVFNHHDAGEDAWAAAMVVLMAEEKTGRTFDDLSSNARKPQYQNSVAVEGNQNGPLFGHVVCFTGQLNMSRTDAATHAAGAGITVKTSVSKKVTLLVVGDQDLTLLAGHDKSTKHRRAEELIAEGHSIRIMGEAEFLALLS